MYVRCGHHHQRRRRRRRRRWRLWKERERRALKASTYLPLPPHLLQHATLRSSALTNAFCRVSIGLVRTYVHRRLGYYSTSMYNALFPSFLPPFRLYLSATCACYCYCCRRRRRRPFANRLCPSPSPWVAAWYTCTHTLLYYPRIVTQRARLHKGIFVQCTYVSRLSS